jgi:hypothetical protein
MISRTVYIEGKRFYITCTTEEEFSAIVERIRISLIEQTQQEEILEEDENGSNNIG